MSFFLNQLMILKESVKLAAIYLGIYVLYDYTRPPTAEDIARVEAIRARAHAKKNLGPVGDAKKNPDGIGFAGYWVILPEDEARLQAMGVRGRGRGRGRGRSS